MIGDNVRQKITNLIGRAPYLISDGFERDTRHTARCTAWLTEALNVVSYAIPSPQNVYRARIESTRLGTNVQRIASIAETFKALLPDIDAGLLGNLSNQVRA